MSVTDNAFIKAYRRGTSPPTPEAETQATHADATTRVVTDLSGSTATRLTTLVESGQGGNCATFVTSVGHTEPRPPKSPSPAVASTEATPDVVWRPERAEPRLKGPHRWPSSTRPVMTNSRRTPEAPHAPFVAKWEVDQFNVPSICQQLQERCATQLTDVIRGVLQSAWQGRNMLAITSFDQREGGTTLAITLAYLASCFDIPVALVDGNTHHPELGKTLGLAPMPGWESYGPEQPLEEVAVQEPGRGLAVLPYAGSPTRPTEAALQSADLIRELTGRFELVVIDSGPMFAAAHTWFAEPAVAGVHGAIVVRDIRHTEDVQLHDVLYRLDCVGIANVGIIENFIG